MSTALLLMALLANAAALYLIREFPKLPPE